MSTPRRVRAHPLPHSLVSLTHTYPTAPAHPLPHRVQLSGRCRRTMRPASARGPAFSIIIILSSSTSSTCTKECDSDVRSATIAVISELRARVRIAMFAHVLSCLWRVVECTLSSSCEKETARCTARYGGSWAGRDTAGSRMPIGTSTWRGMERRSSTSPPHTHNTHICRAAACVRSLMHRMLLYIELICLVYCDTL